MKSTLITIAHLLFLLVSVNVLFNILWLPFVFFVRDGQMGAFLTLIGFSCFVATANYAIYMRSIYWAKPPKAYHKKWYGEHENITRKSLDELEKNPDEKPEICRKYDIPRRIRCYDCPIRRFEKRKSHAYRGKTIDQPGCDTVEVYSDIDCNCRNLREVKRCLTRFNNEFEKPIEIWKLESRGLLCFSWVKQKEVHSE